MSSRLRPPNVWRFIGLTIHVPGANGIRGTGAVNLTVDRSTVLAVNPPMGRTQLISVVNDTTPAGPRAQAVDPLEHARRDIEKLPPQSRQAAEHRHTARRGTWTG